MKETSDSTISNLLANQKIYFAGQQTKSISFRMEKLRTLKKAILKYQLKIEEALWLDLHKSGEEAYLTEISIVMGELNYHLKKLKSWARPKKVRTPLHLLPSSSRIHVEPLGVALLVAPWNYPFQLLINPLVGAISSGCCSMLKPSPDTPMIAKVMEEMISEFFAPEYICLVQGGRETNTILFSKRFDLIFFTGSPMLGRVVMKAAAENLTPVVLELGGKSPCIVDADANIQVAARRIAWGKLINAGQTCIAPDYLLVHEQVKESLLAAIELSIREMYGHNPKESRFYPRIVSQRAMERLSRLLQEGSIRCGGEINMEEKYIAPTIIDDVKQDFLIMQEEIFGPILPVLTFTKLDEALDFVNNHEKPLAFYFFGKDSSAREALLRTSSGGGCINDTIMHIVNHHMPFGGVGNSGLGSYHGHKSFLAFSHERGIVKTPTWIDLPLKYVPFRYFKWIKKLV